MLFARPASATTRSRRTKRPDSVRTARGSPPSSRRRGDVIIVWRLDRLGRNLRHPVNLVRDLNDRDIGIRVLAGQGASIDTTTASGKLVFAIFAALAEFERELIRERTLAGLASARARGRKGGRPHALSKAQLRLAQAAMA